MTARKETRVENAQLTAYREAVQQWASTPTCKNHGRLSFGQKRDLQAYDGQDLAAEMPTERSIVARAVKSPEDGTVLLLIAILAQLNGPKISAAQSKLWDDAIGKPFPSLVTRYLLPYLNQKPGKSDLLEDTTLALHLCSIQQARAEPNRSRYRMPPACVQCSYRGLSSQR